MVLTLKETKSLKERGLLLIPGMSGSAICIWETRVTFYSHWRQRLDLGFWRTRLVLAPLLKHPLVELVCISAQHPDREREREGGTTGGNVWTMESELSWEFAFHIWRMQQEILQSPAQKPLDVQMRVSVRAGRRQDMPYKFRLPFCTHTPPSRKIIQSSVCSWKQPYLDSQWVTFGAFTTISESWISL